MVLKRKTKRKNLRYFWNVFATSLLVILQIVTPIQAVNALSIQETETLSKDLVIAAISEEKANQYAADLQTPDSMDFSDNQDVQLSEETDNHYFFVQNTLENNDEQNVTEIDLPKNCEYNEVLTKKLNERDKTINLSYDSKTQKISIKWSQESAKTAIFVLSGSLSVNASICAKTVNQGSILRSNQINLISGATISDTTSSETSSDLTSETTSETTVKNTKDSNAVTDNIVTESRSKESTQSTTTNENTTKKPIKASKAAVKGSSFDAYDWTKCDTNEFLACKSPTNPNYYQVIGFGGLGGLYWGLLNDLQITQEQMFVLKASKVANPEKGPTMEEIKNNAVGYLFTASNNASNHGFWDGTICQGISFTFEDGTKFQTNPGGNNFPYNEKLAIKTLEKSVSEDGLPMLKASTDSINMGNNHIYQISMILQMLPTGRVAHYYTMTNMGQTTDTPTVVRNIHTYLAGEHKTQTYALGNNKGMYLKNTLKEDGSLAYEPYPERASDPYRVDFPVDGYEGEANNWLGSHDIINTSGEGPQLMATVFEGDIANNYKLSTGDEVKNFPADYNLLSEDGKTISDRDGGIFYKWNNLSIAPGETAEIRYDTSLTPLGTLKIDAEKTYTNETNTSGKNHEGDKLKFDLKSKNASQQEWTAGSIVDVIPDGLTVDTSTFVLVGVDGKEIKLSADIYDTSTRTLKVELPDVSPEQEVHVKFEATLDKGTADTTVTNTMQAFDASGNSTPASVDIKVEKADGSLTLDVVPNLYFGLNAITMKDTTYKAYALLSEESETAGQYVPNYVQVSDHRATRSGWTLAVAQTDPFTSNSGETLGSNTELRLMNPTVTGTSGSDVYPSFLASVVTLMPNNEEQPLLKVGANKEETWKTSWGTVETEKRYTEDSANPSAAPKLQDTQVNKGIQLTVPGQVKKTSEKYVTNLDWVLSDTPAP